MLIIAIIALIGFVVIGGIYLSGAIYQGELRSEQAEELMTKETIANTQYLFLDARRVENGFLLSFDEKYVSKHTDIVAKIRDNFLLLHEINEREFEAFLYIDVAEVAFTKYVNLFDKIVSMWRTIGLTKNDGLRGATRHSAHELEKRLNAANERDLVLLMLMMRRYEKDFLMRTEKKYIEELLLSKKKFLNALSASSFLDHDLKEIRFLLETYHRDFTALADLRLQIFAEIENLNRLFTTTLPVFKVLITEVESRYQSFIVAVQINYFNTMVAKSFIILIITVVCISLAILIGRGITRPIKQMANAMTRLADGELDIEIPQINSKNEIGAFAESMLVFKDKFAAKKRLTEATEKEREIRELVLKKARDAAEAGERAKTAFFANMSHEIRTPMNSIIGYSEVILQDKKLESETVKQVSVIHDSAKFLLNLINSILDLSKIDSGKLVLESVSFHLPNLLKTSLQLLAHQAEEKKLEINSQYADQLPCVFIGDANRLRQVILNLVDNAIKFTETGNVTVSVQSWGVTDLLHFSITDTGIGMTEEQVALVFERFSQANESTTRRFGGTGLGTTISKQLVHLMGGEIWVESKLGQGTTFHFTIKLAASIETDGSLYREMENDMPIAEYIAPRKFQILLAEDVSINAALIITRLEQQGHTVTWVENGNKAIEKARGHNYDAVLMDIMMPELDGLEATIEIRKIEREVGRHLPIIALTANVMVEDEAKYYAAGMDAMVAKPIDFNSLFVTLENAVPDGCCQLNTCDKVVAEAEAEAELDFSCLKGKINYIKALESWRSPSVYASALITFKFERLSDAIEIKRLLTGSTKNFEAVRIITHTLRGVAGNLGIESIADLVSEIDVKLCAGKIDVVMEKLDVLHQSLQEIAASIEKLNFPVEALRIKKIFNTEVVRELLVKLSFALGEHDTDAIEPYLDSLDEYLNEADMVNIRKQLELSDFDNAQTKIEILLKNLT